MCLNPITEKEITERFDIKLQEQNKEGMIRQFIIDELALGEDRRAVEFAYNKSPSSLKFLKLISKRYLFSYVKTIDYKKSTLLNIKIALAISKCIKISQKTVEKLKARKKEIEMSESCEKYKEGFIS